MPSSFQSLQAFRQMASLRMIKVLFLVLQVFLNNMGPTGLTRSRNRVAKSKVASENDRSVLLLLDIA
jgi:hypothetical protein